MKKNSVYRVSLIFLLGIIFFSGKEINAANGDTFTYNGIKYTVISESDGTVRTKTGTSASNPGAMVSTTRGTLELPETVEYNGKRYTLTEIGMYSFASCTYLEGELRIPDTVTDIGKYAFYSCKGFSGNLYLGKSLKTIDAYAFYGDGQYKLFGYAGLTSVTCAAPTPPTFVNKFSYYNIPLYVPEGSESLYQKANIWKEFKTILPMEPEGDEGPVLLGDANDNGIVTVADVVTIAIYLTGNEPEHFSFRNADLNKDGKITVADINALINLLMEQE